MEVLKLMKKSTKILAGIAFGGVVTAIAVPFVLPALGAVGLFDAAGKGAISALSGAALTSASCAVVTGTIAGTFAVIITTGAVIGGTVGAACCSKKELTNK
jgi:hypothetical protein